MPTPKKPAVRIRQSKKPATKPAGLFSPSYSKAAEGRAIAADPVLTAADDAAHPQRAKQRERLKARTEAARKKRRDRFDALIAVIAKAIGQALPAAVTKAEAKEALRCVTATGHNLQLLSECQTDHIRADEAKIVQLTDDLEALRLDFRRLRESSDRTREEIAREIGEKIEARFTERLSKAEAAVQVIQDIAAGHELRAAQWEKQAKESDEAANRYDADLQIVRAERNALAAKLNTLSADLARETEARGAAERNHVEACEYAAKLNGLLADEGSTIRTLEAHIANLASTDKTELAGRLDRFSRTLILIAYSHEQAGDANRLREIALDGLSADLAYPPPSLLEDMRRQIEETNRLLRIAKDDASNWEIRHKSQRKEIADLRADLADARSSAESWERRFNDEFQACRDLRESLKAADRENIKLVESLGKETDLRLEKVRDLETSLATAHEAAKAWESKYEQEHGFWVSMRNERDQDDHCRMRHVAQQIVGRKAGTPGVTLASMGVRIGPDEIRDAVRSVPPIPREGFRNAPVVIVEATFGVINPGAPHRVEIFVEGTDGSRRHWINETPIRGNSNSPFTARYVVPASFVVGEANASLRQPPRGFNTPDGYIAFPGESIVNVASFAYVESFGVARDLRFAKKVLSRARLYRDNTPPEADVRFWIEQFREDERADAKRFPYATTKTTTTTPPALPNDDEIPYAIPVPGKPGFVYSPYDKRDWMPYGSDVDVTGFAPGMKVHDPRAAGKIFRVPPTTTTTDERSDTDKGTGGDAGKSA